MQLRFLKSKQTLSISYCFCICFYSFDRKNISLYNAKAWLVAAKGMKRTYFWYYAILKQKVQPISYHWSLSIPPENIKKSFSDGYRKRPVAWNGLRSRTKHIQNRRHLEMKELILGITCFFVYVGESDIKFSRTHNLNMVTVSRSK